MTQAIMQAPIEAMKLAVHTMSEATGPTKGNSAAVATLSKAQEAVDQPETTDIQMEGPR